MNVKIHFYFHYKTTEISVVFVLFYLENYMINQSFQI